MKRNLLIVVIALLVGSLASCAVYLPFDGSTSVIVGPLIVAGPTVILPTPIVVEPYRYWYPVYYTVYPVYHHRHNRHRR